MTAKLFKTIRDGDIDELQQLIDKGASVNEADKKGLTPLMECAIQGFEEGIVALLGAGNFKFTDNTKQIKLKSMA